MRAAELLAARHETPDGAERLPSALTQLMCDIGMPNGVGGVGFGERDIADLAAGTIKEQRLLATCPREVDEETIARILGASISNW